MNNLVKSFNSRLSTKYLGTDFKKKVFDDKWTLLKLEEDIIGAGFWLHAKTDFFR